jgi:hypothetical protein
MRGQTIHEIYVEDERYMVDEMASKVRMAR